MVAEAVDRSNESKTIDAPPAGDGIGSVVSYTEGTRRHPGRRRLLIVALGVLVLAAVLWFGGEVSNRLARLERIWPFPHHGEQSR
jgi:hypothetical protein